MACTEFEFVKSAATIEEELKFVRLIIAALRENALKAAANGDLEEYRIDDGQTIISTKYRSPEDIYIGLKFWLQEEQRLINMLFGNKSKLLPCKTPYLRRFPR